MNEWYDGTSEFNARGNPMVDLLHVAFYLGGDYGEIPLVTSCTTELTSISSGLQLANQ